MGTRLDKCKKFVVVGSQWATDAQICNSLDEVKTAIEDQCGEVDEVDVYELGDKYKVTTEIKTEIKLTRECE